MRKIRTIAVIAFMALALQASAKDPKWLKSVKNSVFNVIAYDTDGRELSRSRGFFISTDGTGITDRSVLVRAQKAVTIDAAGTTRPIQVVTGADDIYDAVRFSLLPDKKLTAVQPSKVQALEGDQVFILTLSADNKTALVPASVSKTMKIDGDRFYYNLSLPFDSAYTGCPVFDDEGAAIGIVQAGRRGDKETYVLDALHITDIEISTFSLDSRAYSEIGIRKMLPSDPDMALAYVMIKQSTATSEQYGKLLEDFMIQFPDNPDGIFNMGSYLIQETDSTQFDRGIELIEKSISVADDKDRMHCDYANLIYNTIVGRQNHPGSWTLEKALEEINAALAINEVSLYMQLQGNILYAMKRYPEAFDSFMKLNNTDQATPETYLFAYTVRRQMDNDPDICITLLDSTIAKFGTPLPQRAASYVLERATIKEDAGRNREAVADYNLYEQMLGANSMSSAFYFIREQVEIKARMYEQALADINQARLLAPQDSSLILEHASLLLRIGNYEVALPLLKELEANYPDQPDIQRLIGVCYLRRNDNVNARKYLTRAKELGDKVAAQLLEE